MEKQMIWGLATLLLLLGIAAVFLFIDKDTTTEPEMALGQQTKDLLEQGVKPPPAETDRQPPPEESPQERHAPEETTPVTPQAPPKYIPDTPIPEDMPMPDIPLPADLKNMDWKQWSQKHMAEWKKYIHALDPAIERIGRETETLWANMPPESSPDYVAAKAKWNATMLEQNQLINEQGWRIHQADASGEAAFDKYKLARFGKK